MMIWSCFTAADPVPSASPPSGRERRDVDQVICKPDWNRHGKAAPFRRNDELLNLAPEGGHHFPGSGITENLIDKARHNGIPVHRVAA